MNVPFIDLSRLVVAKRSPDGEKAHEYTALVWPTKERT